LILEGDPLVSKLIAELLAPLGQATMVRTLRDATIRVANLACTAFIIDADLPDGSGLDFLAFARATMPNTPAAILLGSPSPEVVNIVFDLGGLYVGKPIDGTRLDRFATRMSDCIAPYGASRTGMVSRRQRATC
jgi:DNA-binding response OmpR family regulator